MDDIFNPTGNTPFEKAEARLAVGVAQLKAASALDELCKVSAECDVMINVWRDQILSGSADPETRMLAAEALKQKREVEASIQVIVELMNKHFPAEA